MSCCDSFVLGSVGVDILMTVRDCKGYVVPLTDAVSVSLSLRSPLGTPTTRTPVIANPEGGLVRYTTVSGDFTSPGTWKAQLTVVFPGGKSIRSKVFSIQVDASL